MPVRGVYSKDEAEFLAKVRAFKLPSEWLPEYEPGRSWPSYTRVAAKELIAIHCKGIDDPNPLFVKEDYARNTRWGGIIAPPFFTFAISQGGAGVFDVMKDCPASMGTPTANNAGSAWDFYHPIRAGDSFRIREAPDQVITDISREDGEGPRQFLWSRDKLYYNQKDEVVAICHKRIFWLIVPPGQDKKSEIATHPWLKEYVYKEEELAAGDRTWEEQEIRGATPRFWEDVRVGDLVKPVVNGPITLMEQVLQISGELILAPFRRKQDPSMTLVDPLTNVPHHLGDYHVDHRIAQQIGLSLAFAEGTRADFHNGKMLSHWYGDDGFLRKYDSQHRNFCPLGDTVWHRGRVTRKYIDEGKPMVTVACLAESVRGWINTIALGDVILPSRGAVPASFNETLPMPNIRVGERVRIKDRPDWPVPYRFAGAEGVVYQFRKPTGTVAVRMENVPVRDQVTETIKPGMTLLFQVEHIEKA
jgi:acyl dehydratase